MSVKSPCYMCMKVILWSSFEHMHAYAIYIATKCSIIVRELVSRTSTALLDILMCANQTVQRKAIHYSSMPMLQTAGI